MARPKPLLLRIFQNPNFYAFLFGGILVTAAFYIFLNQRIVGRQMTALLRNHFLMSKDAGDPSDLKKGGAEKTLVNEKASEEADLPAEALAASATAKDAVSAYTQIEVGFFELSRENLMILAGKIQRDEGDWHVVYFDDAKAVESLQSASRKLPGIQEKTLPKETKENFEIDAGDIDPDLQMPYLAVGVDWLKGENLHWALDLQLPPPNTGSTRALAQSDGSAENGPPPVPQPPPVLQLTTLEGNVHFTPQSALLLVYDPAIRSFTGLENSRLTKSPLRVLASDDFRAGYSALVVWVRLK